MLHTDIEVRGKDEGTARRQIGACPQIIGVPKWMHYKKPKSRSAPSQSGGTDSSHSFRRAETAWREHRGGNQHLPELDVHVFVHAGNEGGGGGKKKWVNLHPLCKH